MFSFLLCSVAADMALAEGSKVCAMVECEIVASPTSRKVIGKLAKHQEVEARGPVVDVEVFGSVLLMLPIKPRGAVLVNYLKAMASWVPDVPKALEPVTQGTRDHFRIFSDAIQCAETNQELDSVEVAIKLWRIDGLARVLGPG